MRERLQRALEWLGFTPTQREAFLRRQLATALDAGTEQRLIVGRLERLLTFRESLGAGTIDVESLHEAILGEGGHP